MGLATRLLWLKGFLDRKGVSMYGELLPIGSVVCLKGGEKRLMVVGRVTGSSDAVVHDYSAVLYPEGLQGSSSLYFFDDASIDCVYSVGYQDEEEAAFKERVLSRLGKLEVRDGSLVSLAVDSE